MHITYPVLTLPGFHIEVKFVYIPFGGGQRLSPEVNESDFLEKDLEIYFKGTCTYMQVL